MLPNEYTIGRAMRNISIKSLAITYFNIQIIQFIINALDKSKLKKWALKMITYSRSADLLALVCGVFCEFVTFPLVSWVRCGT